MLNTPDPIDHLGLPPAARPRGAPRLMGKHARVYELADAGDLAGAEQAARRILAKAPGDAEMVSMMGYLLIEQKRWGEAEFYVRRGATISPEDPASAVNLLNVLSELHKHAEALPLAERAMALAPEDPDAVLMVGQVLTKLDRKAEALEVLSPALVRWPDHAGLCAMVGGLQHFLGAVELAVPLLRRAVLLAPTEMGYHQSLAIALQYDPAATPLMIRQAHEQWGKLAEKRWGRMPALPLPDPDGPLRIGLLSPDLRGHAVACFVIPMVENHGPELSFIGYNLATKEDAISARIKRSCDRWMHVPNPKVAWMAEQIRRDRIDVLVDLAGHTNVSPLAVFAMKPAPVQVSYIGYPSTAGLTTIDARLVDRFTDPPGSEHQCLERLTRLEPPFLCYSPLGELPAVQPAPSGKSPDAPITFGSFGSGLKLNGQFFALAARVMERVPNSRLLILNSSTGNEQNRRAMRERIESFGVPSDRLDVDAGTPGSFQTLQAYGRMDVELDTFPFVGPTTNCEALIMGVPVVSLVGDRHAARVGLSELETIGRPQWAAKNEDEFVEIAAGLADDRAGLVRERGILRNVLLQSKLCDGRDHAARFEAAIRGLIRELRAGR